MRVSRIITLSAMLILTTCARKAVLRGEFSSEWQINTAKVEKILKMLQYQQAKLKNKPLQNNYYLFRLNEVSYLYTNYTITEPLLFSALSNEFDVFHSNPVSSYLKAIENYLQLTNKYPDEKGFLYQRVGICYFRMNNYSKANQYLSQAVLEGFTDAETYYYKALLQAFYRKNFKLALYYIKRIEPQFSFYHQQDLLAFQAFLERENGNSQKALNIYKKAWHLNSARFYVYYDLLPFLLEMRQIELAQKYVEQSFAYLTSLPQPEYHTKAYRQKIMFNRLMNKSTYVYSFDLPEYYNLSNNFFYYSPNTPYFVTRKLSAGLLVPVEETKIAANTKVYWAVFEDYIEFDHQSGVLLVMGNVILSNIRWDNQPYIYWLFAKRYVQNPLLILLGTSNLIQIVTNYDKPTNSPNYLETKTLPNVILTNQLNFEFYIDGQMFDVDRDNNWDLVTLGYNPPNELMMTIFYPARMEFQTVPFSLSRHNALLAIQDLNDDGENEIILLDDKVYFLKPKAIP